MEIFGNNFSGKNLNVVSWPDGFTSCGVYSASYSYEQTIKWKNLDIIK